MSSTNPYVSPGAMPPESKTYSAGTRRLQYGDMFGFAFTNPNWTMNVLWGSGCLFAAYFIPILPQLVLSGYLWEVLEKRHRRDPFPRSERYQPIPAATHARELSQAASSRSICPRRCAVCSTTSPPLAYRAAPCSQACACACPSAGAR